MIEVAYVRYSYTPSVEIDQTIEKIASSKNITISQKAYLEGNITKGALDINDFIHEAEKKNAKVIYFTLEGSYSLLEKKYWITSECGIVDEYKQIYITPIKTLVPWPFNLHNSLFNSPLIIYIKDYNPQTIEYDTWNPVASYTIFAVSGMFIGFFAGYLLWLVFWALGIESIGKQQ
jgi:hypothetical protein